MYMSRRQVSEDRSGGASARRNRAAGTANSGRAIRQRNRTAQPDVPWGAETGRRPGQAQPDGV